MSYFIKLASVIFTVICGIFTPLHYFGTESESLLISFSFSSLFALMFILVLVSGVNNSKTNSETNSKTNSETKMT